MMLDLRNKKTGELVSRNIINVSMDMLFIEEEEEPPLGGKSFYVSVNKEYRSDGVFSRKEDAEEELKRISAMRNEAENDSAPDM